jgi:hypothetical protein
MSATKVWWIAICTVAALLIIGFGGGPALAWLAVPAAGAGASLLWPVARRRWTARRVKAEAAEGIERLESWLRTAPGLASASRGAVVECCPICGLPVDPCSAKCRRHGACA